MKQPHHPIISQLDALLSDMKSQSDAREKVLQSENNILSRKLVKITKQIDKHRGKCNEYRSMAAKYRRELVEARRALRNSAKSH